METSNLRSTANSFCSIGHDRSDGLYPIFLLIKYVLLVVVIKIFKKIQLKLPAFCYQIYKRDKTKPTPLYFAISVSPSSGVKQ